MDSKNNMNLSTSSINRSKIKNQIEEKRIPVNNVIISAKIKINNNLNKLKFFL